MEMDGDEQPLGKYQHGLDKDVVSTLQPTAVACGSQPS